MNNFYHNTKKGFQFLILFLTLFSFEAVGQITNPTMNSKDVSYCDITKIVQTTTSTTVYFKYTAPTTYIKGGWVCLGANFFIRDTKTKVKYTLVKANDIPICPVKYNFSYQGQTLEFNLVFPAIPTTTSKLDIIEDETSGGFNFYGVNLTSVQSSNTANNNPTVANETCDDINTIPATTKPSFQNFLAGVKYVVIIGKPNTNGKVPAFNALYKYLQSMGFSSVEYMDENYKQPQNLCDEAWVSIGFQYSVGVSFYDISMTWASPCNGYTWNFSTDKRANDGLYSDPKYNFGKVLRDMYGYTKSSYNSYYSLQLPKQQTCWTEAKLKNDMLTNGCDNLEGIYENSASSSQDAKYKLAVHKINGTYYLIYLSGAANPGNWSEGEIKATLQSTATSTLYKANWLMANKSLNTDFYVSFENGLLNVMNAEGIKDLYIKLFPSAQDDVMVNSTKASSGTGFAISSKGFIATNYHVTKGASSIKVRGINGDFLKLYSAKVVIEDKNNDLAIIQINDPSFTSLGTIPFTISNKSSDVGSSVFALGYPLKAVMGDEIKLTNGIVSSKSGFQGDVTSYQISVPLQPGNSGGPLFDANGSLVGIVNAKLAIGENVSYAIKSSYLINLIDIMQTPPSLPIVSTVSGKQLTEQVKILNKFVYIIEIN